MKAEKQYLGGMTFTDHAQRKYSYTITDGEHKGVVIIHETYTPRIRDFQWGTQQNTYSIQGCNTKTFDNMEDLIKSLNEKP